MDARHPKRNPAKNGEIKRVSDGEKTIVRIPIVVEPIEVELAVAGVAPEISDVTIIHVPPDRFIQNTIHATAHRFAYALSPG